MAPRTRSAPRLPRQLRYVVVRRRQESSNHSPVDRDRSGLAVAHLDRSRALPQKTVDDADLIAARSQRQRAGCVVTDQLVIDEDLAPGIRNHGHVSGLW